LACEPQPNENGERLIWLEERWINRLRALRGPGESVSDVSLNRPGLQPGQNGVIITRSEGRGPPYLREPANRHDAEILDLKQRK
jgi:hypothetical protein